MIECCGEEMLVSGDWYHCRKCQKRLLEHPHGKELKVLADLIVSYVQEFNPTWKEIQNIIHELWREGYYEDYEATLPEGGIMACGLYPQNEHIIHRCNPDCANGGNVQVCERGCRLIGKCNFVARGAR